MSFIAYDLIFLLVFTLATIIFLYNRRSNLKRQGLLYLYHKSNRANKQAVCLDIAPVAVRYHHIRLFANGCDGLDGR